jgi:hypothetical protein
MEDPRMIESLNKVIALALVIPLYFTSMYLPEDERRAR